MSKENFSRHGYTCSFVLIIFFYLSLYFLFLPLVLNVCVEREEISGKIKIHLFSTRTNSLATNIQIFISEKYFL